MITTDDPQLARRMARLRVHGMEPKYHHHEVGFNSRLDALQAAVLRVKLRHLDAWTSLRREVADRYRSLFAAHGLDGMVGLPVERPGNFHVYNQFVIRVPATIRDPLRDYLTARKIGTEIYYPIPLHLQACFASLGHKPGDFPQLGGGRPRDHRPADLPRADRRRAALRRRLDSPVHRGTRLSVADLRQGGLIVREDEQSKTTARRETITVSRRASRFVGCALSGDLELLELLGEHGKRLLMQAAHERGRAPEPPAVSCRDWPSM